MMNHLISSGFGHCQMRSDELLPGSEARPGLVRIGGTPGGAEEIRSMKETWSKMS